MKPLVNKLLACLGVFALALTALVALPGLLAQAVIPGEGGEGAGPNPALIDSRESGRLHIHKYTTPAGAAGNGTELKEAPAGASPVKGVKFRVSIFTDINLTTQKGWEDAYKLSQDPEAAVNAAREADTLVGLEIQETDEAGLATFEDMSLGLYYVEEVDFSGATVNGEPVTVTPSRPFFVTVPITDPNNRDAWLYDVHVYPKNAPVTVTKAIDEDALIAGRDTTFTITTDIPAATDPSNPTLDKYVIMDQLPELLTYKSVSDVKIATEDVTFAETTDYTISEEGKLVKVTFTSAGLEKLAAHRGKQVSLTLTATVNKIAEGTSGVINNIAYLVPSSDYSEDPNTPGDPTDPDLDNPPSPRPPIPSTPTESHYGKIRITKKDGNNAEVNLQGAVFELYTCEPSGGAMDLKERLFADETFETDAQGTVLIDSVRASDFKNGQPLAEEDQQFYCLVETKAPEGYSLLADPVIVKVMKDELVNSMFDVEIKNVKHNGGFNMPFTGSTALPIAIIAGLLLIAGAVAMEIRRRSNAGNR